jgi:DNA-binding transcriptional MerR regulator
MAFDPDEYLKGSEPTKTEKEVRKEPEAKEAAVSGFDPDAYLKTSSAAPSGTVPVAFDPDRYLSSAPVIEKPAGYGVGTFASDIGKLVGAGGITGVLGAPEAAQAAASGAARETTFAPTDVLNLLSNPQALTNKLTGTLGLPSIFKEEKAMNIVPEPVVQKQKAELDKVLTEGKIQSLRDITEYGSNLGKKIEASISPEMKDAMAMSQPSGNIIQALDTGDFSKISMGEAPSALGLSGQFAKVFGSTAPLIATALVTKSAAPAAVMGFGQAGSEGVSDARDHIKAMSDQDLAKNSEYFRNLVLLGYDPAMARRMTEEKAADTAALYQGVIGALGGEFTGNLVIGKLDKALLSSARNRATRILQGATIGATEEGLQEMAEGLATDLGINKTVAREMGADSFANLILGALGGGGPGGVRGAVAPGKEPSVIAPEKPVSAPAAPAEPTPTEAAATAPEASIEAAPKPEDEMFAEVNKAMNTTPLYERDQLAKAAAAPAVTPAAAPQQTFENIEQPKFAQDDTGEKLTYPMFVDLANKGYQLHSFENPRTYTNKGGVPYRTLEKDGVRIALEPQQVLFADPKYPNRQPQLGMGNENDVAFHFLGVDPEVRNQGKAREALADLVEVADQNNYTLYGEPAQLEKEGMTRDQLTNLYKQYGFEPTDSTNKIIVRKPVETEGQVFQNFERLTSRNGYAGDEVTRAPSLRVEMNRLSKLLDADKITPEMYANLSKDALRATKKERKFKPRVRGMDQILSRIRQEVSRRKLDPYAADFAEWFLRKNPDLVDDLGISIKAPGENVGVSGTYADLSRIITLFKGSGNPTTAVHEILHHTERMMPQDIQDAIRESWLTRLVKAKKAADKSTDENLKKYFKALTDYHLEGDTAALKTAKDLLKDGKVDYDAYQYINPSEYWAVNATDILDGRYMATNSVLARLKQWLKEFLEFAKSKLGLANDNAVLKALKNIVASDGKFLASNMLHEGRTFENIERKNYKGKPAPLATWAYEAGRSILSDKFIYNIQDRMIDTKRVLQAIKKQVGEISSRWDAYDREVLYHGRASDAIKKYLRYDIQKLIEGIQNQGLTMQEVKEFLHMRHAQERNESVAKINPSMPDAGSGIETAVAKKYLKDLDKDKRKKLEAVGKSVDELIKKTQKVLVDTGQETQETIDSYNKAYKHYVPLFREELDYVETGAKGTGRGFSIRGAFSRRAMGSQKPVQDILTNVIEGYERAVGRGEKNLVLQSLYGLAIQNPNPDFWMPINPDAPASTKAAKLELAKYGISPTDVDNLMREPMESYIDPKTGLVGQRLKQSIRDSNYALPLRIDGKQRYIIFNPNNEEAKRMVLALKNMDLKDIHQAFSIFSTLTRWFVGVNTQYNPFFGIINFLRDVQGSALNLTSTALAGKQKEVMKRAVQNLVPVFKALRKETRGEVQNTVIGEQFADMQAHGGQTGYRDSYNQKREQHKIIEDTLARIEAGPAKKALSGALELLSDLNDAFENAVRLAVYQVAIENNIGKTKEETKDKGAVLAKTISVNFNKRGASTQEASALWGFFNSSVQGTARTIETLKGPAGKKIVYGGLALGGIQAVALALAGFDDEQPPPFVRDKNLIIPIPGTDKKYFSIPMPFGLNIFPNLGRTAAELMLTGGKNASKKLTHALAMIFDSFNPLGGSESLLQMVAPTALDPLAALAENRDSFGRPIAKQDRATAPTPGHTRAKDNASFVSKELSHFLNFISGGNQDRKGAWSPTPDQIDYVIGQLTGGIGREMIKLEQGAAALGTGEEIPPYKIPVIGRFYGDAAGQAAQSGTFYDNVTKLSKFENEIKGRMSRNESYSEILRVNPEASLWRKANRIENEISALNKRKRDLVAKDAPVAQIKQIEEMKRKKMEAFNKEYERAVK